MLGKLEDHVPNIIKLPLDVAVQDLKKYKIQKFHFDSNISYLVL